MESRGTGVTRPAGNPTLHPGCGVPIRGAGHDWHSSVVALAVRATGVTITFDAILPVRPNRSTVRSEETGADSPGGKVLSVACGNTIPTLSPSARDITITEPASGSQLVTFTGVAEPALIEAVRPESDTRMVLSPQATTVSRSPSRTLIRAGRGNMEVICPPLRRSARSPKPRGS